MDTIRLTGVQGMGTHGVLNYEHQRAQPFIVDAVLHLDLSRAGSSDDLPVSYTHLTLPTILLV